MADDPYSTPTDTAAPTPPEAPVDGGPEDDTDEEDDGASCLVPASAFGADRKPGDTFPVKILHVFGKEYEIGPAGDEGGMESDEDPAMAQMQRMSRPMGD
jgi:hypothetical protein